MAKFIIMPKLGFNMNEGKIVQWLKSEGDKVEEQEPILQIETDKSVIDVESQVSGILRKILVPEGEEVTVTLPIAIIGDQKEDIDAMLQEALEKLGSINKTVNQPKKEGQKNETEELLPKEQTQSFQGKSESIKISPRARKKAKEIGLDLDLIRNKLPKRIIQEKDIIEFSKKEKIAKVDSSSQKIVAKEEPYSGMRQIIGNRLSESKFSAPHIYFSTSVDMSNVLRILDSFKKEKEIKVSVNDFLIFIIAKVLAEQPRLNSSLINNKIVYYSNINIGIAVGIEEGLIVPVLKGAEKKSLVEISEESKKLIALGRDKKLMPEDYQYGTFTISNLGMFDIEQFTAIINPPESAILAVGSIIKKPIVDNNNHLIIRPMMKMTLSVDHRIIDGIVATMFLNRVKKYLTNPGLTLM